MFYQANTFYDGAQCSLHSSLVPRRQEGTKLSTQHLCFVQCRYSMQPTRVPNGKMECIPKKGFYTPTDLEFFAAQDISSTGHLGKTSRENDNLCFLETTMGRDKSECPYFQAWVRDRFANLEQNCFSSHWILKESDCKYILQEIKSFCFQDFFQIYRIGPLRSEFFI